MTTRALHFALNRKVRCPLCGAPSQGSGLQQSIATCTVVVDAENQVAAPIWDDSGNGGAL
jgi:hypothetical protein